MPLKADWWIVLIRDVAVCVFKREATVSSITISEKRQNRGASGRTEVKLRGWQLQQLVNVHFRELVLRCFLFRACRCVFFWVGWLVLCSLLPINWPILSLLLLGRLHLGLGFGQHRVAGWVKLLNREKRRRWLEEEKNKNKIFCSLDQSLSCIQSYNQFVPWRLFCHYDKLVGGLNTKC